MSARYLIADIGATHARFAVAEAGAQNITPQVFMVAGITTLEDALRQFFTQQDIDPASLGGAVLCAAGPVDSDGVIRMTNCAWVVDPALVSAAFPLPFVRVINDFTAAALGLPHLSHEDVEQIGGGAPDPFAPKAILGPGTGLGVSGLVPHSDGTWTPLASEGGHVDLAPHDDRQLAIVFHLLRQFGHVSPERILSGPGLETLHQALCALDGVSGQSGKSAADIAAAARKGDAIAVETIHLFCTWLGATAGDLALTLGARGGVYLAGGILPQWGPLFDRARFRRAFEAKGRFVEYLSPIPCYLVTRKDLALLGCLAATGMH